MSQEEIIVPKGWTETTIGKEIELAYGKNLPKPERIEGDYPVYGSNGIVGTHREFLIDFPSIVIGRKGTVGSIHKTNAKFWPTDVSFYVKINDSKKLQLDFVFYLLHFLNLPKYSQSGPKSGLNRNDVYKIECVLPPLPTQKQIVAKLDHILGELKVKKKEILSLIEQNKERIDFFEKNWMSYVIDREIEKHPQREEWEKEKLSELISDFEKRNPETESDKEFKYVEIGSVNELKKIQNFKTILGKNAPSRARNVIRKNDVIYGTTRPYYRNIVLIPMEFDNEIATTGFCVLRIKDSRIQSEYLFYYMLSNVANEQIMGPMRGGNYPAVSNKDVIAIDIPLPPIPIQKQIIQNIKSAEQKFQSQKKQFENIKNNYESKIKYINHIQSSVLDSAFSGKLVQ